MQNPTPLSPETLAKMAAQLIGIEASASDLERVAGLLNALAEDMRAMRNMDVGVTEPASTYRSSE